MLEEALERLRGVQTPLTVAGRTDAGVHARGQVASHEGDPSPAYRLNGLLPPDVRVVRSEPAADGFDARRDAKARAYRYRVHLRRAESPFERGRALHWPHGADRALLDECAALVVGTHDFTAFTPTQTDHVLFVRPVSRCEWVDESEDVIALLIEAETFMRHMVRTLVGSMLAVANGRRDVAWFTELLDGRPRAEGGDTAPSHGLYLERVTY
jgi:tRNA pseudouridine38-40 synthase